MSSTDNGVPAARRSENHDPAGPMDRAAFTYSIVVPVYNSAEIVGRTIDSIVTVFERVGLSYELILVNDGSRDGSWDVIADRARHNRHLIALNLLRNYGQHFANLAGMREASGDYVITMDDDLQNPPDQALLLIEEAMDGHDVVFGRFERKQAGGHRRLGSKVIGMINRRIFAQPPDLVVSNFRILRRDVVDRICASRVAYPYITGQALMYSNDRSNVTVRHDPRPVGKSTYGLSRIIRLVLTIMFAYSSFPLRFAAGIGALVAVLSFLLGAVYLVRAVVGETDVPGWTSLIVLLAFFNGVTIALLSMLGEYVVRTLNTVSAMQHYHVIERVEA